MDVQQIKGIGGQLRKFVGEFGDCFGRREPREHLYRYVQGQLSDLARKSVEPIALAACAWVNAQAYPSSARTVVYEQTVRRILYYQRRNRQARPCHWKKTRRTLRAIGIDLRRLRSCAPDDL